MTTEFAKTQFNFAKLNAQDALQNLSQLITFDLESNMPNSEILFDSDSILESNLAKAAKSNRYANKYVHISLNEMLSKCMAVERLARECRTITSQHTFTFMAI